MCGKVTTYYTQYKHSKASIKEPRCRGRRRFFASRKVDGPLQSAENVLAELGEFDNDYTYLSIADCGCCV